MRIIFLISGLMLLTLTTSLAETTNNLVSQDFTSGWSGTNINTKHGNSTIAGVNGKYVESDSISLNDSNVNKGSLNNGFEIIGSSEVWFWNNNSQSVTQTIKTTDDSGNILTQNRILSGNCATFNGCGYGTMTDTMIFNSNTAQDYDVSLKYEFSVPNTTGHYGADLKNPSLIIDYTYSPDIEELVEQELIDLFTEFKPEEDLQFEEKFEVIEFFNEPMTMELVEEEIEIKEFIEIITMPEKEPEIIEEMPEAVKEIIEEKPEEEVITKEIIKEAKEEMPEEIIEEEPEQITEKTKEEEVIEEAPQEAKEEAPEKEIKTKVSKKKTKKPKIDKIMAKVDEQIKDSAKNLQIKNIIKLDAMQSDQASLVAYNNVEFYKPKDIYLNQIEIFDNRSIYADIDLVKYTANDIMEVKIKKLNEIKSKKRLLLLELQELKNG